MINEQCPVCNSGDIQLFKEIASFSYYECCSCEVLFISPDILTRIDAGIGLINYKESYWKDEPFAAKERSWGSTLARVAEVFLYSRVAIRKFIDIGSGPGYLLDSIQYQLPLSSHIFYANELFPPPLEYCTSNKNYLTGSLSDVDLVFNSGCCIEVIEHLTPGMVIKLFSDLATKSFENSIYIFNTGLSHYVKNEDTGYLDPLIRGHIMSWSIKGLRYLAETIGFQILPIPGKSWAFIAEYKPTHDFHGTLEDRIWQALPENMSTLKDKKTGDLMYIMGLETTRAYH